MTEEVKKEPTIDAKEPIVPQYSEDESKAIEQGWRPKEEFEGDPSEFRSAKEFLERGEIFKQIHTLKRQNKVLQDGQVAMRQHYDRVAQDSYKKAMEDLRAERKEALREGDAEKVDIIEEKIEKVQATKPAPVQTPQGPNPAFVEWVEKNSWYETDEDLHDFADAQAIIFLNKNPGSSPDSVFKHVEKKIKDTFASKFQGKRAAPDPVTRVEGRDKPRSRVDNMELSEDEAKAMRSLVKAGHMTEAEYRADLKKIRG